jgi:hypothetical protein
MMPDTDWADAAAMLRAKLTSDERGLRRLTAQVAGRSAADAYRLLLTTAFGIAVRQYFRDRYTAADVILLVAKLRSDPPEAAETIDPVGAESVIRTALGEPNDPDAETDDTTRALTEDGSLMLVIGDRQLTDEELDAFIADAVTEAGKARRPSQ